MYIFYEFLFEQIFGGTVDKRNKKHTGKTSIGYKKWGRANSFNNKTSRRDWMFKGDMQQGIMILKFLITKYILQ